MSNLLFISNIEVFKTDLLDQIKLYAPEFNIINSEQEKPDVIIIDEDKEALNQWLQKSPKAPIIFITSDDSFNSDKVYSFFIKPLDLSEFIDETKASINIFYNSDDGVLAFNCYKLLPIQKEIINTRSHKVYKLTEKEVAIIKYLYIHKDRIVSKDELMQEVWGYSLDASTHTIETHIYRLRQKVEEGDNQKTQLILTSDGGYLLNV